MSNNSSSVASALNHGANSSSSGSSGNASSKSGAGAGNQLVPTTGSNQIKLSAKAKETAEKLALERKKGMHVVVYQFLYESGFLSAAKEFANNVGFNTGKVAPADNIDLDTIFIEYEEYYQMKFGRKPKFFRRGGEGLGSMKSTSGGELELKKPQAYKSSNLQLDKMRKRVAQQPQIQIPDDLKAPNTKTSSPATEKSAPSSVKQPAKSTSSSAIDVSGKKVSVKTPPDSSASDQSKNAKNVVNIDEEPVNDDDYFEQRILKPLPDDLYYGEMRELAEVIRRDILVSNPEVFWSDIAGLADAKQLVQEAVVMPLKYPELFTQIPILSPWNGVLLFGPPGTGKTMLAKAVATECRTTFFNISASSIVSKWRGDSEKLVRILFELAEHYAPSTIFLDELDSIMSHRMSSSGGTEHEGSRRMKTELLIQMDGLSKRKGQVFVLAASNLPWDLDQAMLRRLEKRVFVGLPDETSRCRIFQKLLGGASDFASLSEEDCQNLAQKTEDYSGADLALVCKESAMRKLRQVMAKIVEMEKQSDKVEINPAELLRMDKVVLSDVELALGVTKPSGSAYKAKYEDWKQRFGSNYSM